MEEKKHTIFVAGNSGEDLSAKIAAQGDKVRSLKSAKAPADQVKDELVFEGPDNAAVSLCAARVNQVCKTGPKDHRKFLDGIYVSQKTKIEPKEE